MKVIFPFLLATRLTVGGLALQSKALDENLRSEVTKKILNRAHLLRRLEGWKQLGIDIEGEKVGDESGGSVSLSADGSTVAIGARFNYDKDYMSGHAAVFRFIGTKWSQVGSDIDGDKQGDQAGGSVSLSGDGMTLAVGASFNDGNGMNSGHTRVFKFDGRNWNQMGPDIDGEAENDYSGRSVSLSSDGLTLAVGADYNDGNGTNSGHTRVFKFDDGTGWNKLGADINGEMAGDSSGKSVSLSSDGLTVAVGAIWNDGNGQNSGHTRVFRFDGIKWKKLGSDIDGKDAFNYSGWSVSLSGSGSVVAIGSTFYRGHVRVLEFNGTGWNQLGLDLDGKGEYDQSGQSVTLSSDGSMVAIGALTNNGNGYNSGHTRVFNFDGKSWKKVFEVDGKGENDDSGKSVALSSDGLTLAVGASGRVHIYRMEMPGGDRS